MFCYKNKVPLIIQQIYAISFNLDAYAFLFMKEYLAYKVFF
jgi:hypothetical protein